MKHRIIQPQPQEKEIPRPCTGKQTKRIIRHLLRMGEAYAVKVHGATRIEKRALAWLGQRVNRQVATIADLTWKEAGKVIEKLPVDGVAAIVKE